MNKCHRCKDKIIHSDLMNYCLDCTVTFILQERGLRPFSLNELREHLRIINFKTTGLDLEWIIQNYKMEWPK